MLQNKALAHAKVSRFVFLGVVPNHDMPAYFYSLFSITEYHTHWYVIAGAEYRIHYLQNSLVGPYTLLCSVLIDIPPAVWHNRRLGVTVFFLFFFSHISYRTKAQVS